MQKTKSGILLPDAAAPATNEATVLAVGSGARTAVRPAWLLRVLGALFFAVPGSRTFVALLAKCASQAPSLSLSLILFPSAHTLLGQEGKTLPLTVKEGDKVLLPDFGGTKITIENKVSIIAGIGWACSASSARVQAVWKGC